ncbi:MAG: Protein RecA [Chloroflexi bacterium]|nr:Protein RecA [Chloroflexota bacterium]
MTRQRPLTALDEVVGRLQRRHGPAAVRWGGDPASAEVWPTGIPVLDAVLPQGLPCGRIAVLTGERGRATGRLTLLQALAARASRSMEVAYVDLAGTLDPGFLADLGADLDACYVVRPPRGALGPGLAMARTLVAAGVPWLAVALGSAAGRERGWEHALSALVGVVQGRGAVACVSAPSPPAAPLAYASSLTVACAPLDWQLAHGDVTGLRVRLTVVKSKIGGQGGRLSSASPSSADDGLGGVPPTGRVSAQMDGEVGLLLRYPRPHSPAEVVGLPAVVEELPAQPPAAAVTPLPASPALAG